MECPDGTKNVDFKVPKVKSDSTSTPAGGTQGRGVTQQTGLGSPSWGLHGFRLVLKIFMVPCYHTRVTGQAVVLYC